MVRRGIDPAKLSKSVTQYIPEYWENRRQMMKDTTHVNPETHAHKKNKRGAACVRRETEDEHQRWLTDS